MNERLFRIRKELNLTQEQFAEKIGITRSAVANMESGSRSIIDRTISDICREFDVSEDWLRAGAGEMFVKFDANQKLATLFAKFAKSSMKSNDKFAEALMIEMMTFMVEATEEEWKPIKRFIKRLAASMD